MENAKNLLPRHRHIFQELVNSMWDEFKCSKINTFIMTIFLRGHITMIPEIKNIKQNYNFKQIS